MAFVLAPQPPIADWLEDFDCFAKRSPGFFAGRPVVVDIAHMPASRPELVHMVSELKRRNVTIMGLDGRAPGELGADARGLPPILSGGKEIASLAQLSAREMAGDLGGPADTPAEDDAAAPDDASATAETDTADTAAADEAIAEAAIAAVEAAVDDPAPSGTLVIDEPVRSGQSIVHLHGDVIVVGAVASGAEVVSAGSIHIYGALRGRAIAGSKGDRKARIFCHALHAELVAIDGLYKTNEDLEAAYVGHAVQAWLDGDALKMAAFSGKGN